MFGSIGPELRIVTVAQQAGPVKSYQGPETVAQYGCANCPPLDLILLPGGIGTIAELSNEQMLAFLRQRSATADVTMSVCSGSALLAKAGILDGKRATSNKQFFSLATAQSDKVKWVEAARWVDEGNVATSSGVSAGRAMALALSCGRLAKEAAEPISVGTEYTWHRDANRDPFVAYLNKGGAL